MVDIFGNCVDEHEKDENENESDEGRKGIVGMDIAQEEPRYKVKRLAHYHRNGLLDHVIIKIVTRRNEFRKYVVVAQQIVRGKTAYCDACEMRVNQGKVRRG